MINSKKILVIAKDPALSTIMEQELQDEYEIVCTQRTGVDLKDIFYEETPDFIILDIMMPNLDGIGVCLTIRQWSHVPIMMLSTWGTGSDKVCGLNLGSETYLTEPFGAEELKARICETMMRNAAADPMPNISSTGLL
jgi:DNA-binding response OmpR family regulator